MIGWDWMEWIERAFATQNCKFFFYLSANGIYIEINGSSFCVYRFKYDINIFEDKNLR